MKRGTSMNLLRTCLCLSMLGAGALLAGCNHNDSGSGGSSGAGTSGGSSSSSSSSGASSSGASSSGGSSSGSSGSSSSGGPSVSVTFQPPVPSTVAPGGNFGLSWSSTGVTSCTASGAWSGTQPVSGAATVAAPATPGVYNYTLTCSGAGGTATATATETVSGTATGVPVFTQPFTATPAATSASSTVHFSWAVSGAGSCSAVGGSGSDGWSGSQPLTSPSGGVAVAAPANPGSYTYALFCTGSAGSSAQTATVTVSGTPAGAAPSFSAPFLATPSAVANGAQFAFSWASNATSCAAAGGAPGTSWSGVQPATSPSGGVVVAAPATSGAWTYLLGCNGPGGTVIKQSSVTVGGTDCGVSGTSATALLAPHAAVTSTTAGALCLICTVSNQQNVINTDPNDFATIHTDVALLSDSESLTVTNDAAFPAGHQAGFVIDNPTQTLTLDLLQTVTLSTYLKGQLQETAAATATAPLRLDLLSIGVIGNTPASFLSFTTTKDFDALQITDSPLVGVIGTVDVYRACVSRQ